jgi:uncharacterized repeat protein (TIGR03847 family)
MDFERADEITVGAFGEPGQRVFLLQIRGGARVLTVKVEKAQAAELGAHLIQAMADRPAEPSMKPDVAQMPEPADPAWAVGSIRLGYDSASEQIAIVLEEFQAEEDADRAAANITISADQAAALAGAIGELVSAGRPPCPHCGYPLDPSGHVCPKSNGHRPPKL